MPSAKAVAGCLLALALVSGNVQAADAIAPLETVWKPQLIELRYWSSHVSYSCLGIANKVSAALKQLGARPGIKVWSENCRSGMLSRSHLLKMRVETPFEATPALLQELSTFDAREQLIARVRGEALPNATDVERFPANWKPVTLSREFESGDCELMHMLYEQVLPKLAVRAVTRHRYCSSFGSSGSTSLKVVALVPITE